MSKNSNSIAINKIEIKSSPKDKKNTLSDSEIKEIQNSLKEKYSIEDKITINST